MSDTAANQAEYPQHRNQLPGCGFPIPKLVVIFSLLTGAVVGACIAPLNWSEIVISRLLYSALDPEDVLLADQVYQGKRILSIRWKFPQFIENDGNKLRLIEKKMG